MKLGIEDGKVISREHITLQTFIRGDFFGGRGMLDKEDIDETSDPLNKLGLIKKSAKLSVVSV